jgi:hypothetical protein
MRGLQRAVFVVVVATASAALAVPFSGHRAGPEHSARRASAGSGDSRLSPPASEPTLTTTIQQNVTDEENENPSLDGRISVQTLEALGLSRTANLRAASERHVKTRRSDAAGEVSIQSGQPLVLNSRSALSAALITTIGGRDNQFSEVMLIADWDGREDCAADREQKLDDFSFAEPEIDQSLTRVAISEHTVANGFAENVYYYGDTLGNFWIGTDLNPGVGVGPQVDVLRQVNLPTLLNTGASGGFTLPFSFCADDQIAVTGIAVNPVADLCDFGLPGTIGEVVYISAFDSEGCVRNGGNNQIIRTRILSFAFTDGVGAGAATPAGVREVVLSNHANIAGVSVDDDGSLYFQLVDLIQFTGGAIFKLTELPRTGQTCPGCINRTFAPPAPILITSLNSAQGTTANPILNFTGFGRLTNYSGPSSLFGDVVAITNGGCNVLYAAVSRSFVAGDVSFDQLTEGLFPAPTAFGAAGTPSMIICFADCSGLFDVCSGIATGSASVNVGGILPVADGFADVAQNGLTRIPGVNNFRIFVQGNGPNLAPAAGGTAIVPGTPTGLLKVDMQVDYTLYSGLAVNEQNTVFVISGGTPAGIGKNPSPMLGEVLCFEDGCPSDRRADFVDLRGDTLPNPPASGGNVGDSDSDRFDHIFYQAPLDQLTLTPSGLAGLAGGFLRYTNRLAPSPIGPGVTLGVTQRVQGDDDTTTGTVQFENLDPGHQVAGGDDQNTPFRGDDDNGAGTPPVPGALSGGFEFVFGGPVASCVWNGLFINSNGNVTFGIGDTANKPTVPEFRSGPPRIAPAWADLNPSARAVSCGTFPVQALGFANINAFKVRWINVPEFGNEGCTSTAAGNLAGASNTFSVTLFDDGTGIDENANQPLNPANPSGNNAVPFDLQEGPTDLRYTREPNTGVIVGCPPRPEGSGIIVLDFCRMDLLGTDDHPVITGYSIGGLNPLNPPGLCEINLSEAARAADTSAFGVIQGTIGAINCACCIGEGTEPTIFELFNEGLKAGTGSGGEVTFARPDFDLRFEGNDAVLCTSARQRDLNRGRVCLFGVGCAPPANPQCFTVVPGTVVTTPTTTGVVNALCAVQVNLVGCGFFPNETTIICQGFQTETGIPLQRAGKTVTTAATLACDTNGDGTPEAVIALTSVTPVSCNLLRATIPVSASFGPNSTTGFPSACCGGVSTITVTTTFTVGDNNVFGAFTRTTICSLNLGTRAPVVISVTPSSGPCGLLQDVLITGACFQFTQAVPNTTPIIGTVTSVFAVDLANAVNVIQAMDFTVLNANLIDAHFNFTSANAGKTFVVHVVGPGGTSRGLITPVAGQPAGCALGNELGCLPCIEFTCTSTTPPPVDGIPVDQALVNGCKLDRNPAGNFVLDIFGKNLKPAADIRVGSVTPKVVRPREPDPGFAGGFLRITLKGRICNGLPGTIVVTNPPVVPGGPTTPSQPFVCSERCAAS